MPPAPPVPPLPRGSSLRPVLVIACLGCLGCFAALSSGQSGNTIMNTRHNLSALGPGSVRAATEEEVCVFCHTPHNAAPKTPLWNRTVPVSAYRIYGSRSLDALPGQPTGASKLCLSCHDGTIAVGSVLSRSQPIGMIGGITTLPPGRGNLGTDLSDDHPVSFRYDDALAAKDPKLKSPAALPAQVKLDRNREMQCTSCHDAHNDRYGKFLVMDNAGSQLCKSCHQPGATAVTGHQECSGCHQPHSAPSGPLLLRGASVRDACLNCHGGQAGTLAKNLAPDLGKASAHDTASPVDLPDAIPDNVGCSDCHQPHTMGVAKAAAPHLRGNFGRIGGVNLAGGAVTPASYEYEVCFKCHADRAAVNPWIGRQIVQNNTRLEFAPSAVSYHPVAAAGKNPTVPSLKAGYSTASLIYCSDCHTSDTGPAAGGTGPGGTHGSNQRPLLAARYETADNTSESADAYALCYRCHDRTRILADSSFKHHKKHIEDKKTPCSACHDAHGISSAQGTTAGNSHLINFDRAIVQPSTTGRLEWQDTGTFHGRCYLKCHGKNHDPKSY